MRRVMYLHLPGWPIDRLRRSGAIPSLAVAPADAPPFATVIEAGGRRLLAAVNPAAAAGGLAPGMPLADALAFLPGLATAAAAPAADAAALGRLAEWCTRYSPWTAPDGADGVKIEITGCAHLWGGEAALAADLARRLSRQDVAHRIAVAGSLGAAWALARFAAESGRPALPAPPEERAALAPLPVEALRLDPATAAGLRRVGLRRVGELYPMPRDALARRFGPNGFENSVVDRLDQALGDLPEPLSPLAAAPVRRVRLSFAEPIADPADLARAAERLAEDLAARLAREGLGARRLDLAFHRVDGRVEHIRLGTARPSRDPRHLAGLFLAKLETIDPGLGVEDMILAVFAAEKLPPEQACLHPLPLQAAGKGLKRILISSHHPSIVMPGLEPGIRAQPTNCSWPSMDGRVKPGHDETKKSKTPANTVAADDWSGLAPLLDRLGTRFGSAVLSRLAGRESHIPECASVWGPTGDSDTADPLPRKRGRVGVGVSLTAPRPVRLFWPPEPIEASWMLPDDPPFLFTWRRRPYRVRRADGAERIAEEWWSKNGAAAAAVRDYYRVEDEKGRRFWLFRAGPPGDPPPRWFMHGVFA